MGIVAPALDTKTCLAGSAVWSVNVGAPVYSPLTLLHATATHRPVVVKETSVEGSTTVVFGTQDGRLVELELSADPQAKLVGSSNCAISSGAGEAILQFFWGDLMRGRG